MNKMINWKTGTSSCFYGNIQPETLAEFAGAGISCLEISTNRAGYYDVLDFPHRAQEIGRQIREAGLEAWSIHLPFSRELDISHADKERREQTMRINLELIAAAAEAGIGIAVVHPSSEPIADDARSERMKNCQENAAILCEKAKSCGMRLAVENLPRTCLCRHSDEMQQILAVSRDIGVVFDTNHLLMQDNVEFIQAVGSRIITLHVSDYDFIDERHQMPLEGKNRWKDIIAALENCGYTGPWLYEIGSKGVYKAADLRENYLKLAAL